MDNRPLARVPARRRAGGHRLRAHDGAGRPAPGPTRWPSRRCGGSMDAVPIDGTIVIGEGERDEAPMLYIGEKVGLAHARAHGAGRGLPAGRHRRRSARGHEPLRHRARRTRSRCSRRPSRGGLLHAPDLYMEKLVVGPQLEGRRRPRRAGGRQPGGHREVPRPRRRGPRRGRARPPAAREADRRHPRDRRAHPADRRRRPLGRHRGGRGRQRRARRDGHRRRARRRADGGGHALPERRDLRAARRPQAGGRGALPRDGHHRPASASTASADLASGENIIFAATGVTDGTLMKGVRFFGDGIRTSSLIMQTQPAPDPLHRQHPRRARASTVRIRF